VACSSTLEHGGNRAKFKVEKCQKSAVLGDLTLIPFFGLKMGFDRDEKG
jgi:hypothetical protein